MLLVIALLGVAMAAQIGLAHALGLLGARYGATGWLRSAVQRQVDQVASAWLAHARGRVAALVTSEAEALRGSPEQVQDRLNLTASDDTALWLLIGERSISNHAAPECSEAASRALEQAQGGMPTYIVCRGVPWAVDWVDVADSPARLVFGRSMTEGFVGSLRAITSAEAIIFVDREPVATSIVDDAGRPVAPGHLAAAYVQDAGAELHEVELSLPSYAGYEDEVKDTTVGKGTQRWYLESRALDREGRVELAVLIPQAVIRREVDYALVTLIVGAIVIVGLMGVVVGWMYRRFIAPLERLSDSARRVSSGELGAEVPTADGHPMGPFIRNYNRMLERLRDLVTTRSELARQAGMAEIAVGVLHNVGNALTGVHAGVELTAEALDKLPVEHVERLADLLEKHRDGLPAFVGPGAKGEALPDFIRELATALRRSQVEIQAELDLAVTAAAHAGATVRAQQRNARLVERRERCSVPELIDDALSIARVEGQGIEIERQDAELNAWVDRHRFVQVVVNLLTNARDAIRESQRRSGRISISAMNDRRGNVIVRVTDDGVGVKLEHRDRIFSMGHTTKVDGHGFGLHTSANYAREMGGDLRLETSANGMGATFELTVPGRLSSTSPLEMRPSILAVAR